MRIKNPIPKEEREKIKEEKKELKALVKLLIEKEYITRGELDSKK